ncbi:lipid A biosynthesis acyltransferase [Actinotalea ferrariae CF5-4]|uniref:Lipid A biosynthesis acyltransferase n=1 Tax=Actinotalea ferrariae CF5-4 TaxID=948458 RepID=A0A021VTD2_9CELL|nr:phosphatidylinositol mannoside acyltransferase [Actinotalea ferrariae]EYR64459.1 lipid A biosynthesis acyltransferase [Actinotalea ferrariae CF5-4]
MSRRLATHPLLVGWHVASRLPEPVVRGVMHVAADVAWARRGSGVRRLEGNLARVRPDASPRELRRLSRAGMRTYLRYYAETFLLARLSWERIDARVRAEGLENVRPVLQDGSSLVLALSHQGNWDLAGAWATRAVAPVLTVAERLEPAEVFEEFLRLREGAGVRILPLDDGGEVFRDLVRAVRGGGLLVPLLADRDLTSRGIEVELFGERARVAAGPAALAVTTGAPLLPVTVQHERLRGARRRAAGCRWGVVIHFHPAVTVPEGRDRTEQVAALTQRWVDVVAAGIAADPTHWHMLQRVFVADLDPARRVAPSAVAPDAAGGGA